MACFALMLQSQPASPRAIVLMVDERRIAEEIAVEMRRKGHPVDIREVREANFHDTLRPVWERPGAPVQR